MLGTRVSDFDAFFRRLTSTVAQPDGVAPYPYQTRLAEHRADLIEIATGLGKTEAVIAAWLWQLVRNESSTPRRLIYSLPMRSLVEQTETRVRGMLTNAKSAGLKSVPALRVVMGGDVGDEWFENPDSPSIVVGTQDMLLSRALNRGYAMSRFQWPMSFGAINNDVLWVIDEVQLQGIGAVTAAQLQGLREKLGSVGPVRTQFMSATLDPTWLDTVDHHLDERTTLSLNDEDLACEPVRSIVHAQKFISRVGAADEGEIARAVADRHRSGTLTLTILNTVDRARSVHRHLQRLGCQAELLLLHSRFRPDDRKAHVEELFAHIYPSGPGRIAISTQVVEAGIDVDATTLITDVAPWSSIVQRLGRCNRRGRISDAACYWIDSGDLTEKTSIPYDLADMAIARQTLLELEGKSGNPAALPKLPITRGTGLVLRRADLFDLFDTSSDLLGHDVDVSRFIREAEDFTASVFWRDEPPSEDDPPHRAELCPASLSDLRKLLKKLADRGHRRDALVANQFGGTSRSGGATWVPLDERSLRPGLQLYLQSEVGWYDPEAGFGERYIRVAPVSRPQASQGFRDECTTNEGDRGAHIGVSVTLSRHALDTAEQARLIIERLAKVLDTSLKRSVVRAALWHDVGKAHKVFQDTMRRGNGAEPPAGEFWAKSVKAARHGRRGFRHELASALAFLNANGTDADANLVAYLIAAHHGKVRFTAQPLPSDAESLSLLGNCEGDVVPEVVLDKTDTSPEFRVNLSMFRVGSPDDNPTWVDRVADLRDDLNLGPFRLGFLELLVRVADWRASETSAASPGAKI